MLCRADRLVAFSLEPQLTRAACRRCWDLRSDVGGRGWLTFAGRPPAESAGAPVPRKLRGILSPVDNRGFITPVKQPSHDRPMHPRVHEGSHRGLGRPTRTSPKRVSAIPQQSGRKVAVGRRRLTSNSKRLDDEHGKIQPRPHPKPRNRHEWHRFLRGRSITSQPRAAVARRSRGRVHAVVMSRLPQFQICSRSHLAQHDDLARVHPEMLVGHRVASPVSSVGYTNSGISSVRARPVSPQCDTRPSRTKSRVRGDGVLAIVATHSQSHAAV